MDFAQTALAVQSIGTCLVAFFLWQLGRAIRVRFVTSWALAAFTFGIALFFLLISVSLGSVGWQSRAAFSVFMAGTYLMSFLFWSGLREYARGTPFALKHLYRFAPLIVVAGVAPWLVREIRQIVPVHFIVIGVLFAATIPETFAVDERSARSIGRRILQISISWIAVMMAWHAFGLLFQYEAFGLEHRSFGISIILDSLAELFTVFGLVILSCERVRDELERKNLELERVTAELESVARTDGLTGLLNRRAFEEWSRSQVLENSTGSIAAIDVNDLKLINDTFLHAAGDAALKLIARSIQNHFRVTDPIFRVGGDEFVIIMPNCGTEELTRRLEAIDRDLQNRRLPGVSEPCTLRIAWGIAAYSRECTIPQAHELADRAMYENKSHRKSQLPVAELDSKTRKG